MAVTTELIEGNRSIASEIVNDSGPFVLAMIGDSLQARQGITEIRAWSSFGIASLFADIPGSYWQYPVDIAGVCDSAPASPNHAGFDAKIGGGGGSDFDVACLQYVDISGGTTPAEVDILSNRAYSGSFRPRENDQNVVTYETPNEIKALLGYDWLADALAAGDVLVDFYVYRHPDGPQTPEFFFQARQGATTAITAPSTTVSGYAATPGWERVTCTIPQSTVLAADTAISVNLRLSGSVDFSSDAGTTFIFSSFIGIRSSLPGVGLVNFGVGGSNIQQWSDLPADAYSLMDAMGCTHFVHQIGTNPVGGYNTPETFRDAVIAQIAKAPSATRHIFVPQHTVQGFSPAGGEVDEAYYVEGYSQVVDAQPQHLLLNRFRLLPPYEAMADYLPDGTHHLDDFIPANALAMITLLRQASEQHVTAATLVSAINADATQQALQAAADQAAAITEDDGAGGRRLKTAAAKDAVRGSLAGRWTNQGTGADFDDISIGDIP
ncbi:hypothetical protein [Crateriforma conspicua]|uniref:Uncharacterized protein n=1 Tax=Crateriforma conspicua TaxID=2527996 RepID=A0A5C5XSW3_9PLAN|nr:hypothetical protein [Crateriforma conspicua]TWT65631.1 hypothetical protein Pan14r_51780 [Crateriforma conspicua]